MFWNRKEQETGNSRVGDNICDVNNECLRSQPMSYTLDLRVYTYGKYGYDAVVHNLQHTVSRCITLSLYYTLSSIWRTIQAVLKPECAGYNWNVMTNNKIIFRFLTTSLVHSDRFSLNRTWHWHYSRERDSYSHLQRREKGLRMKRDRPMKEWYGSHLLIHCLVWNLIVINCSRKKWIRSWEPSSRTNTAGIE